MIAYIKGTVQAVTEDSVIVETGDIGYQVKISARTAELLPGTGEPVKIFTFMSVREDDVSLFGFLTADDLAIFRKLITVSGIGPKGALGILSVMDADSLKFAILSGDTKAISKAPGIGAKTAQRMILELKDKVSREDTLVGREAAAYAEAGSAGSDAVEALTALGYASSDALKAVKQVEGAEAMGTEELLKAALKHLTFL